MQSRKKNFDYQKKFEFAGKSIYVQFKELDGSIDQIIEGYTERLEPDHGRARIAVVVNAVVKLDVDGKTKFKGGNAAGGSKNTLPRLYDPEARETLTERLLKIIVTDREDWLADKFEASFDKYIEYDESDMDDEEEEGEGGEVRNFRRNPTDDPETSEEAI